MVPAPVRQRQHLPREEVGRRRNHLAALLQGWEEGARLTWRYLFLTIIQCLSILRCSFKLVRISLLSGDTSPLQGRG